jgi:hypothetical protein
MTKFKLNTPNAGAIVPLEKSCATQRRRLVQKRKNAGGACADPLREEEREASLLDYTFGVKKR